MKTIVVTPRSISRNGHPALKAFEKKGYGIIFPSPGEQPTEAQLIEHMADCVGYIAGVEPITRAVLTSAPKLKAISRNGAGIDNIDIHTTEQLNIQVLRAAGSNAQGVAELTIGHILSAIRGIHLSNNALKNHQWDRKKGFELSGRTLGLIGCGNIGRRVVQLALGFDMQVIAYDPYPPTDFNPGPGFHLVSLDEVLKQSHIISLHRPPSEKGYIIGKDEFARMKPGVVIINTSRSGLIDPRAALQALGGGTVSALTIDAFDNEPPTDWTLVDHPRVLATAHIGGFTEESVERATTDSIRNLLNVLE